MFVTQLVVLFLSTERRVWFTKVLTFRMLTVISMLFLGISSMQRPGQESFTESVNGLTRWFLIRAGER